MTPNNQTDAAATVADTQPQPKSIELDDTVVIKDLAEKMNLPVTRVIAELMKNGIMSGQNERIDFDTASVIAQDLGFVTARSSAEEYVPDVSALETAKAEAARLKPRPPVVVVMGHVDHGKTLLLDAIRQTKVAEEEAGGITQSIGAYQITVPPKVEPLSRAKAAAEGGIPPPRQAQGRDDLVGRKVTFIDTPGHEAFGAMRSRGARIADVAILVVAADDGVKPQTIEALKIIRQSRLPFLVAVNKVDKPEANVERVKRELSDQEVVPEDWGGKTVFAEVSAKSGLGIDRLLDLVLLVADVEKSSIQADPDRLAIGTIIESHIDQGEGPVATVLVQSGTLKPGDLITVGNVYGKVKALKDYLGRLLTSAPPSTPARIIGLKGAPAVGDILQAVHDLAEVKKKVKGYQLKSRAAQLAPETLTAPASDESAEPKTIIPVVIKADTLGSLEAIVNALSKLRNDEVAVKVTSKGLGNITEADVLTAETGHAFLVGFTVAATAAAEAVAKGKDIDFKLFTIIYDLVDYIRGEAEKVIKPEIIRTELGKLKILAVFRTERNRMIVGGQVTSGKAVKDSLIRVRRGEAVVATGRLTQLQSQKREVNEVAGGAECGIKYEGPPVIQVGDLLEFYQEEIRQKGFG